MRNWHEKDRIFGSATNVHHFVKFDKEYYLWLMCKAKITSDKTIKRCTFVALPIFLR